jgi:hypothetical protein
MHPHATRSSQPANHMHARARLVPAPGLGPPQVRPAHLSGPPDHQGVANHNTNKNAKTQVLVVMDTREALQDQLKEHMDVHEARWVTRPASPSPPDAT